MNKSLLTNVSAAALLLCGVLLPGIAIRPYILNAGLFALAGAATNWLAIHMLFEQVPGLYGSGVIAARFEEFKAAIKKLVMENFFTEDNFLKFADAALHQGLNPEAIQEKIDLDALFDGFLEVVRNSKFGGMLLMFGGTKALEPLREPFKEKFRLRITEIIDSLDLKQSHHSFEVILPTIDQMVSGKLDELKASDVKEILSKLMRAHLGWLVIWGGVFGGVLGLAFVHIQSWITTN